MEVKFGVLATSTSNRAKSNLPHGAIGARTHWGQVLVSLRDFPYSLIDFLAIKLGPLCMRHSRRSKLPTSDLTFCSGAATPRRASLRKTLPLLTYGEPRRNSRRRRWTLSGIEREGWRGWFHLAKWCENSTECTFLSPQSYLFFSLLSFRQLPRFHPACNCQTPRGLARQLGTSDRNWKPCCLHGRRAKEADGLAETVYCYYLGLCRKFFFILFLFFSFIFEVKINFVRTCKGNMLNQSLLTWPSTAIQVLLLCSVYIFCAFFSFSNMSRVSSAVENG